MSKKQLDELSSGALARYTIKAASSKTEHMAKSRLGQMKSNAVKGEAEVKQKIHSNAMDHARKALNRHVGIRRASTKMAKKPETAGVCEEVEQIDELSKGLLKRYMNKADRSMGAHENAADNYAKMGAAKSSDAHAHKSYRRSLGIGRAGAKRNSERMETGAIDARGAIKKKMYIDKEGNGHTAKVLAKEETHLNEISAETLHNYSDKADVSFAKAKKSGDKNTMRKRAAGENLLDKKKVECEYCGGSGVDEHGHNFGGGRSCENCDGKGHLFEGNAENKFKKNMFTVKKGMESHPVLNDSDSVHTHIAMRSNGSSSKQQATKDTVAGLKREGRREIRNPTKHEGEYHAHYDSKRGVYDIKHRASGRIVDRNVANSGGAALNRADQWNRGIVKEDYLLKYKTSIEEQLKKKGRPRKARHEDGEIVNDPHA